MSDHQFSVGDVVTHVNGGPEMMVELVSHRIFVVWFDKADRLHRDSFAPSSLMPKTNYRADPNVRPDSWFETS